MHLAAERSATDPRARRITRLLAAAAAALLAATAATSAAAQTIRQYQFEPDGATYRLALKEVERPEAGPNEVLVRVHAVSLNRRDVLMLNARYGPGGNSAGGIPLSDGAGEVIAVGPNVSRFEVGDRVAGIFFEKWIDGDRSAEINGSARGGNAGGMLSEVIVSHEDSLVAIPQVLMPQWFSIARRSVTPRCGLSPVISCDHGFSPVGGCFGPLGQTPRGLDARRILYSPLLFETARRRRGSLNELRCSHEKSF